jgi:alkaline phosphatase
VIAPSRALLADPRAQPDVLFGGGGEYFQASRANGNVSQYDRWVRSSWIRREPARRPAQAKRGYSLSYNKTQMLDVPNDQRALGLFAGVRRRGPDSRRC